ncbi:MAG: DUF5131 family protein, partial [Candidatus Methylomirabilota bacterium]
LCLCETIGGACPECGVVTVVAPPADVLVSHADLAMVLRALYPIPVASEVMDARHTFLVCTKRPERMAWLRNASPMPNVILLTSVSTQADADERLPHLMRLAAAGWKVGVSVEPMLGPVDLAPWTDLGHTTCCGGEPEYCHSCDYGGWMRRQQVYNEHGHVKLSWVVCGAESGPGARSMHPDWARQVRDQCVAAGVPFAYKQGPGDGATNNRIDSGEHRPVDMLGWCGMVPVLDGVTWTQTPWGRE